MFKEREERYLRNFSKAAPYQLLISCPALRATFVTMNLAAQRRFRPAMEKDKHSSPSRWQARWAVAILAITGVAIASYLAAYQLGLLTHVWEPFFGNEAKLVLHSFVSGLLPLPDAALGAIAYFIELIGTAVGSSQRYRTHPRLVLCYGAIVAAAAATAVALVLLQVLVIDATCTLCLCSAAISILIAYLASDEIVAAVEVVYEKRKTQ